MASSSSFSSTSLLRRSPSPSRGDSVSGSETLREIKGALVEHRRATKLEQTAQSAEAETRLNVVLKNPGNFDQVKEENNQVEKPVKIVDKDGDSNNSIGEESKRIWNLRPRRPKTKLKSSATPVHAQKKSPLTSMDVNKSGEKEENCGGGDGGEKKEEEKRKLSIRVSLSKEEIEEDVFALTGSKPAKRPKKRARNIQQKLDSVFPGLWLVEITPQSYKVSEKSLKAESQRRRRR